MRKAIKVPVVVKSVADDHNLCRNALAVNLHYAQSLLSMSRPFYGLKAAAADVDKELLDAEQKQAVMAALGDLKERTDQEEAAA
jgi:hypothetical protein